VHHKKLGMTVPLPLGRANECARQAGAIQPVEDRPK
jgi:hypothetical protein